MSIDLPQRPFGPIPKIIHQIWYGFQPAPLEWMNGWKDNFCKKYGWKYMLWTEKETLAFGLKNKKEFDATDSYQQKSDIARYEIVHRYGGWYLDCDMIYLGHDIEKIIPFYTSNFVGVQEYPSAAKIGAPYCSNGCFAAVSNYPALGEMIQKIPSRVLMNTEHAWIKTGPQLMNQCLREVITLIPYSYVFPTDFHYPSPHIKDPMVFRNKSIIYTRNGTEYPFMKKLKNIEKFGNINGLN